MTEQKQDTRRKRVEQTKKILSGLLSVAAVCAKTAILPNAKVRLAVRAADMIVNHGKNGKIKRITNKAIKLLKPKELMRTA